MPFPGALVGLESIRALPLPAGPKVAGTGLKTPANACFFGAFFEIATPLIHDDLSAHARRFSHGENQEKKRSLCLTATDVMRENAVGASKLIFAVCHFPNEFHLN